MTTRKSFVSLVPWLALEVHPAADGAVVLAARLFQVDASHLARREVDVADVGDPSCDKKRVILYNIDK
jgi:hypothetical protein